MKNPFISKKITGIKIRVNTFVSKYPIYKGVLILGSGTVLAQLITVLTMPVITRLYTPSDFGLLAIYISILSLIAVAASLQFSMALVLPKETEEAANLFCICLISLITTSMGLSLVILFSGKSLLALFHLETIEKYMWLIVVGFFGFGLYDILNYWAVRNRDYKQITYTKINQGISGAFSKIALGVFAFGTLGLITGYIVSQIFGIRALARSMWKNDRDQIKSINLASIVNVTRKYYSFPLFNLPGSIINSLSLQIPVFMLSGTYDIQTVGLYSLASNLLLLPGSFISSSIAQAFMGDAAKILREDGLELRDLYLSTIRHMTIVSVPLIGSIALLSPLIFPFVFGDIWSKAGYYCLPLALVVIPQFIVSPTSKLSIYGYNHWSLAWNIVRTCAVIAGFYISNLLMLSVMKTLTIYGSIMLFMYLVNFWLNLKAISNMENKIVRKDH